LGEFWFEEEKNSVKRVWVFEAQISFKPSKNNIYFRILNLKKIAKIRGSKVFPKIKNGQKKCPIFKNGNIL
jgi:hypothetical protein